MLVQSVPRPSVRDDGTTTQPTCARTHLHAELHLVPLQAEVEEGDLGALHHGRHALRGARPREREAADEVGLEGGLAVALEDVDGAVFFWGCVCVGGGGGLVNNQSHQDADPRLITYTYTRTQKTHLTGYLVTFLPDSAASLSVLTDSTASTASFAKNSDSGPCVCVMIVFLGGLGLWKG